MRSGRVTASRLASLLCYFGASRRQETYVELCDSAEEGAHVKRGNALQTDAMRFGTVMEMSAALSYLHYLSTKHGASNVIWHETKAIVHPRNSDIIATPDGMVVIE